MPKQARVEPIRDIGELKDNIVGWNVIDESQPDNETVVSSHDTEQEAIKAAEEFEQQET
ncbi:hypothetical protein [Pistricoccus aurantiacus]|uniref:hypothetical protein n=1 Tax=Pistricoccus aurantiacus TaxID=1883414 RepID=UPI00164496C1|nr:hypothetical protein [Pistricoccus aurantiacus]